MASDHCIIDSSLFVAFYRDVDALHADALRVMGDLSNSVLIVHPYVIQETTTVLTYQCGLVVAKHFVSDLARSDNVIVPAVDARYDMQRFTDIKKRISFTDATLIELARTTGARIVTFDKQILSLSRGMHP